MARYGGQEDRGYSTTANHLSRLFLSIAPCCFSFHTLRSHYRETIDITAERRVIDVDLRLLTVKGIETGVAKDSGAGTAVRLHRVEHQVAPTIVREISPQE